MSIKIFNSNNTGKKKQKVLYGRLFSTLKNRYNSFLLVDA
jgi:hypothetical protein